MRVHPKLGAIAFFAVASAYPTDTDARVHTSFLKDMAPLPGREIRLIYRINFGGL